ncbi:uncharacterized protein LOC120194294 [Hibiscus syriacus]|uniref:uncharacterized protein LOC120194294 n=1 Tax=Hibiscus syriacus TaxID=106335 RepID=UPI001924B6A8|nr:uncharacterized protein LOC120194294 [Hibiscus syriacus]
MSEGPLFLDIVAEADNHVRKNVKTAAHMQCNATTPVTFLSFMVLGVELRKCRKFYQKQNSDAKFLTIISVLAQERLLGAALGTALTGIIVFEQRKRIYESISDHQSQLPSQSQMKETIFGKKSRSEFALLWNKAVDQIFVPVIESISSRRW